jgi:hypothetical protein
VENHGFHIPFLSRAESGENREQADDRVDQTPCGISCLRKRLEPGQHRRCGTVELLLLFAGGLQPVGVLGEDAEDADLAGEEVELFEGEADVAVVGVALDLGVELGGAVRQKLSLYTPVFILFSGNNTALR